MDINIDTERALSWQKEVKQELDEVKKLLKEVAKSCDENPADDGILKVIEETGLALDEEWTKLSNDFDEAVDLIGDSIRKFMEAIEKGKGFFKEVIQ